MTDFFRFPHTPHLAWLGGGDLRDDKVLSPAEAASILADEVVIEEKVDGANLGFSVTEDGDLQCQNRGTYLSPELAHPQFGPLWPWLGPRRDSLVDALWPDLYLFGEWCLAVHSVRYDQLPDWFLGFDVYDRAAGLFWDTARRDDLLVRLQLSSVPRLGKESLDLTRLKGFLGRSSLHAGAVEGVVVRREADGWTTDRAKLVNASFVQAIDTHWSRGPLVRNNLRTGSIGS